MSDGKTGTEIIAREIALYHGSHITGPTRTVASDHGFGNWGHSPEQYADRHWREYIGAAEAMLARINNLDEVDGEALELWLGNKRLMGSDALSRALLGHFSISKRP